MPVNFSAKGLYSLEYLKSARKLEANVLFCHVPPMNSRISGKPVTADYVKHSVLDLLAGWEALSQARAASNAPQQADQAKLEQDDRGTGRSRNSLAVIFAHGPRRT